MLPLLQGDGTQDSRWKFHGGPPPGSARPPGCSGCCFLPLAETDLEAATGSEANINSMWGTVRNTNLIPVNPLNTLSRCLQRLWERKLKHQENEKVAQEVIANKWQCCAMISSWKLSET
ncbi:hypothetical protein VULLAG_LOCUS23 [Vulpes lagopus]